MPGLFLAFGGDADPADTLSLSVLGGGAYPVSCRLSGRIPGLYLPDASSTPFSPTMTVTTKASPDGAERPLRWGREHLG